MSDPAEAHLLPSSPWLAIWQTGVVDGQDAAAHRNAQLQALTRTGVAQPPVHRLHRLSLAVVQQSLQVPAGVGAVRTATETAGELIEKRAEPRQDGARPGFGHASEGTESAAFVQLKLTK